MKKRNKVLTILLAAAFAGTAAFAGCSLVSTDPQADMNQVIAEVDITQSADLEENLADYAGAISVSSVTKRDLVVMFLNAGSSLVSDGSTYGEAFETLAETLVDNEVLVQYATMATLKDMVDNTEYTSITSASSAVDAFLSKSENERYEWLLEYQASQDEYEGTQDINYTYLVQYTLYSSINGILDDYEADILSADTSSDTSSATVPTGVDTEVENYYPKNADGSLNYAVYTGYSGYLRSESGAYQEDQLEGTTRSSRMRAYNDFIGMLNNNYMITEEDNVTDVANLTYVKSLYSTLLRQQMVSNYLSSVERELEQEITADTYRYLNDRYTELRDQQKAAYDASTADYESAMSSISDTSFLLYTPATDGSNNNKFGYVYNILVPFDSAQSKVLSTYSSELSEEQISDSEYYAKRNALIRDVKTADQRASWYNGGVDYSFDASDSGLNYYNGGDGSRNILFFEDNLINASGRYEELEKYYGMYTYNGTAIKNADGESYTLLPNSMNIDGVLGEFEGYLEFVLGDDRVNWNYWANGAENTDTSAGNAAFFDVTDFTKGGSGEDAKDIDYSKFIYAYGMVDIGSFSYSDLLEKGSDSYKAMSAVNELQYAYTTDTGVLSQYIGYAITAYDTSYIQEFEYAAQYAIREGGAGSFIVCAGDYGWHIIYVTAVLEPGSDSYTPDWSRIDTEGTFEYLFYDYLKTSDLENASSRKQSEIIFNYYKKDVTVTLYEDRYSDLTSLTTTAS